MHKPLSTKEIQEQADLMVSRFRTQVRRQADRLGLFVEFLRERELLDEFLEWERKRTTSGSR